MNVKKYGQKLLVITLILVIILNFLPVDYRLRLVIGSFGFVGGFILIIIGNSKKYKL